MRRGCVSGITPAVSADAAESLMRAVTTASELGVNVSFDCNYRARLWGARAAEAPALLRQLCLYAHLLFGEARDIELILGTTVPDVTAAFDAFPALRWIANTTRQHDSAGTQQLTGTLHSRSVAVSSQTYALNGIVDRIGAGDAFAAGTLHGLMSGYEPQRIVDFATAAASLEQSHTGRLPPRRSERYRSGGSQRARRCAAVSSGRRLAGSAINGTLEAVRAL